MPPLPADFIRHRVCKPICEKFLTLPANRPLGAGGNVIFALLLAWHMPESEQPLVDKRV